VHRLHSRRMTSVSASVASAPDFIEAARELKCDDDQEQFEQRLKKIAKAKPEKAKP
jgi:hypothetical protein